MYWIDGHLDLAYLAECGRDLARTLPADQRSAGCVTFPALRQAKVKVAFGTIFTEPGAPNPAKPYIYAAGDPESAETAGLRQMAIYEQWERDNEIRITRNFDQFTADKTLGVILLMEGADPIRSPGHVPQWVARGLRIVGLTWATGSRYAGGNSSTPGEGPLTPLGIEMVRALDEAGVIHDASHLSDAAFDGLLEHARGPVIASHSNCRALVENKQRHLRDDQIRAIAQRGGVIGLNLYTDFLFPRPGPGRAGGRRAVIADCVAHLEHVAAVMGHRRGVALGSDMDGGFGPDKLPTDLDHPTKLRALIDALAAANWSDDEIEGFAHGNWERFLTTSWIDT